ncbi:MAG: hypothetical protein AAFN41_01050 [Planctomycetota bacterium]
MSVRLWKHPRVRRQVSWNFKQAGLIGLFSFAPMMLWFVLLGTFTEPFDRLFKQLLDRSVLLAAVFVLWPQIFLIVVPFAMSWRELAGRRNLLKGRCWSCGYDLHQHPAIVRGHLFICCPECGKKSMTKKPRRRSVPFLTVCRPRREWTTIPRPHRSA